jgi:hypothetical protein
VRQDDAIDDGVGRLENHHGRVRTGVKNRRSEDGVAASLEDQRERTQEQERQQRS